MSDHINIGILGLGVVGSGTVRVLTEHADAIARKVGVPLVIKKIAVRDISKPRDVAVDPALLTDNPKMSSTTPTSTSSAN